MTNIIEKLARAASDAYADARPLPMGEAWEFTTRAILQTLHDNITPEMARAAADELNGELPALAMRGAIREALATALKGERA